MAEARRSSLGFGASAPVGIRAESSMSVVPWGHNVVPLAQAYPKAEVIAIDTAAPVLRYGNARARSMGVENLHFVQANAEDLSRWPDGHFDWVQTTMFLHELSAKALPRILHELSRVLAPGGLILHLEQPQYGPEIPLYEQFIRDWDAFNNNEPFWSAMHGLDLEQLMCDSGIAPQDIFTASMTAVVDARSFPRAQNRSGEDYGRAAAWNAYGACKAAASGMG
jgi:SAM-dependent methyltransferase